MINFIDYNHLCTKSAAKLEQVKYKAYPYSQVKSTGCHHVNQSLALGFIGKIQARAVQVGSISFVSACCLYETH